MTSFDDLKAKALDLAQAGAAKAKELTDVAKLNIANSSEEDTIRKAYIDLGKLYYAERGMAPEGAYVALCEKITAAKQRMEENKAKIAEIKRAGNIDDDDVAAYTCDWRRRPPLRSPLWWSPWRTTSPRNKAPGRPLFR